MRFQTQLFPCLNATSPGNTTSLSCASRRLHRAEQASRTADLGATTSRPASAGCCWQNKGTLRVGTSPKLQICVVSLI